jgi:hypothetical protein
VEIFGFILRKRQILAFSELTSIRRANQLTFSWLGLNINRFPKSLSTTSTIATVVHEDVYYHVTNFTLLSFRKNGNCFECKTALYKP